MFKKQINILVVLYFILTILLVAMAKKPAKQTKYYFLSLGLVGQVLLFNLSFHIYKSEHVWYSFYMYALMYVLYILSFTNLDIFFHLENPKSFVGKIHKDIYSMFVDFVYVNFSTISTMGSDITPLSTLARAYSSYKIATAIMMIVFLVIDIGIKTK